MAPDSSPQLTINWPDLANERGRPMLWLATWLIGAGGEEGDWFHSGRGAAVSHQMVPPDATGIRVRRWPAEGLAPEYADLVPVPRGTVDAGSFPFQRRQSFSRLVLEPEQS